MPPTPEETTQHLPKTWNNSSPVHFSPALRRATVTLDDVAETAASEYGLDCPNPTVRLDKLTAAGRQRLEYALETLLRAAELRDALETLREAHFVRSRTAHAEAAKFKALNGLLRTPDLEVARASRARAKAEQDYAFSVNSHIDTLVGAVRHVQRLAAVRAGVELGAIATYQN